MSNHNEAASLSQNRLRESILLSLAVMAGLTIFLLLRQGGYDTELTGEYKILNVFNTMTMRELLAYIRPPGYPFFLWFLDKTGLGTPYLPHAQYAVFAGGVLLLLLGMLRFGFRPAHAMVAALAFLGSDFIIRYGPVVFTDALGMGSILMAIGAVLLILAPGRPNHNHWHRWIAPSTLFVAVLASFVIRPAFQIAPMFLSLITILLIRKRHPPIRIWHPLFRIALISTLPLALFLSIRYVTVNGVGVTSFNGQAMFGMVGPMLTRELAAELTDPDLKKLAEKILDNREIIIQQRASIFDPSNPNSYSTALPRHADNSIDYREWSSKSGYHRSSHKAKWVAFFHYGVQDSILQYVHADRRLGDLASEIIQRHWQEYLTLVGWQMITKMHYILLNQPILSLLLWLTGGLLLLKIFFSGRQTTDQWISRETLLMTGIGLTFFFISSLPIFFGSYPEPRYLTTSSVFFTPTLALVALDLIRQWFSAASPRPPVNSSAPSQEVAQNSAAGMNNTEEKSPVPVAAHRDAPELERWEGALSSLRR